MNLDTNLDLDKIVAMPNIATELDQDVLNKIGYMVYKDFETDLNSRSAWEKRTEEAMKLALQVAEAKSFPWPGASNVKFPLITIAALQYHARSYPVLIDGQTPVKCRVIGEDPTGKKSARADRVSNHMSYQVLEEDENWESEMDRVLITQPIIGCAFKKVYRDPVLGHNVSENVLAKDFVVNYWTKHLDTAPRITQIQYFSKNDIYERVVRGLFLEMQDMRPNAIQQSNLGLAADKAQGVYAPESVDDSTPFEILEQHRYLDLDGDGYAEPYIVFVRRDNKQVLRIVARYFSNSIKRDAKGNVLSIQPENYYEKYPFIPSPDGGFYDLGFGVLLGPLNQSIDTLLNQLVDAGTLANTAGGFLSRGVKLRGGNMSFAPMEWKHVDSTGDDLRKGIMPLPVREPSQVLFTLLSLLINYGERIGGSVDILVGQNPGQNTPAETTRTMAEQGMKIFSGIFKRTYRSLKGEFRKLYRLNQLYMQPGVKEYDGETGSNFIDSDDYLGPASDVRPAADPNIVSDSQRIMQAQAVLMLAQTTPGMNIYEAQKAYLKAMKVPNIEAVLPNPQGPNAIKPGPSEKMQIEMAKLKAKQMEMELQSKLTLMKLAQQVEVQQAKVHKLEADAILAIEQAGGVKTGHDIAMLDAQIGAAKAERDGLINTMKTVMELEKHMKEMASPMEAPKEEAPPTE